MKTMVISIRNTAGVRCREVVRFSEGPLWEVLLYKYLSLSQFGLMHTKSHWYVLNKLVSIATTNAYCTPYLAWCCVSTKWPVVKLIPSTRLF